MNNNIDLNKILRMDQPYSLLEILKGLVEASEILFDRYDYDGHGHERLKCCQNHAKEVIMILNYDEGR